MIERGALARALALGFLFLSLAAERASADYRHRVVLLDTQRSEEDLDELLTRLRAELSAAGFEVVLLPATGREEPKLLVETLGSSLSPAAVVLVHLRVDGELGGSVAELWVSDRIGDRTLMQTLMLDPRERSRDMSLLAVQTVELVKARLATLAVPDLERTSRVKGREASEPRSEGSPKPGSVEPTLSAGVGILSDFAGIGSSFAPILRCGVLFSDLPGWLPGLELRLTGAAGATRLMIQSGDGIARVRQGFGMLDAVIHAAPSASVHPFFSVSSGVFSVAVSGEAPEPYPTHDGQTWSAVSSAGLGLWARSSPSLSWVLEAQALAAWSTTRVTIEGREVGKLGAPMLFVSTGLVGVL